MTDRLPHDSASVDPELTRAQPSDIKAVEAIGPYRLLDKVGEGGMGEVWLAEQTIPIRRRVALKVIKAGLDTAAVVARFQAERQALAVMDHPAIARVFEAGSTEHGRPYFAMEYVGGEALTSYSDRHRLLIRERLELFIQVCEGVQHAHQKGIIHRDLKPSNILVATADDRPMPKIIDFGISKATTQELTHSSLYTVFGGLIGTPEYMSPEQAEMGSVDVDTRSDVYALGVVLYELLTGLLPFEREVFTTRGLDEMRRTIREVEPPRPSTRVTKSQEDSQRAASSRRSEPRHLAAVLRGDLDWIVLKALEKDRTKRYQTANALAQDLRRYLADEPVAAGPPSAAYRMRKFARRHRVGVGVGALLLVLLVGFSVVTVFQAARIARERDRANREAQTAEQVISFLVGLFNVSDPSEARGNTLTAREVLDRGAVSVEQTLTGQPEVQARLRATIGKVYINLGFFRQAEELLQKAVTTYRTAVSPDDPRGFAALSGLADAKFFLGQVSEAQAIYKEISVRRERMLGAEHPDTLKSQFDLASTYALIEGQLTEAEALTRRTLAAQRRVLGVEHIDTLASLNNLGAILHRQKQHGDELAVTVELLDLRSRTLGPDHPDTLRSYQILGVNYLDLERWEDAERAFQTAYNGRTRVLGEGHPATILAMASLASAYRSQKRYEDAERVLLKAVTVSGAAKQPNAPVQLILAEGVRINLARDLARLYTEWGQVEKAAVWTGRIPPA